MFSPVFLSSSVFPVFPCFSMFFNVFLCYPLSLYVFFCFLLFFLTLLCNPLFFYIFLLFFLVFTRCLLFSPVLLCFHMFSPVLLYIYIFIIPPFLPFFFHDSSPLFPLCFLIFSLSRSVFVLTLLTGELKLARPLYPLYLCSWCD